MCARAGGNGPPTPGATCASHATPIVATSESREIKTDMVSEPLECPPIPPMKPTEPTYRNSQKLCSSFPHGIIDSFRKSAFFHEAIWNFSKRPPSVTNLINLKVAVHSETTPIKSNPKPLPPEKHRRLIAALKDIEKKSIIGYVQEVVAEAQPTSQGAYPGTASESRPCTKTKSPRTHSSGT